MKFAVITTLISLTFFSSPTLIKAQSALSIHGEYAFPQSEKYDVIFGKPETIVTTNASLLLGYTAFQHLTISAGPSYSTWESTENYRLQTLGVQVDLKFTIHITPDSAFKAGTSLGTRQGLSTSATSLNTMFSNSSLDNSAFKENYAGLFFSYLFNKRLNVELFPFVVTTTNAKLKGSKSSYSISYQNFRTDYGMIRVGYFF
jgi:hypothetical protein